jgi:hydrogenase expression/formation protein HypC
MCVGIPGRIEEIVDEDLRLARVDLGGVSRVVGIGLVDEDGAKAEVGEWVLIHAGFALAKLTEEEAHATLSALYDLGAAAEQQAPASPTSEVT